LPRNPILAEQVFLCGSKVRRRVAVVQFRALAFAGGFNILVRFGSASFSFNLESLHLKLDFEARGISLERSALSGTSERVPALSVGGILGSAARVVPRLTTLLTLFTAFGRLSSLLSS